MKKNCIIYTLIATIVVGGFFTGCKDDEPILDLQLDAVTLTLTVGDKAVITIESGNEGYTAVPEPASILSANVLNNEITVTAMAAGEAVLKVTDRAGKTASVAIRVKDLEVVEKSTPYFTWDQTFDLEKVNNWGLTVFPELVAVTNIPQKEQYILSWDGDFSAGVKEKGILKIYKEELLTETIELTTLAIFDDDLLYSFLFTKGEQTGKLLFSK